MRKAEHTKLKWERWHDDNGRGFYVHLGKYQLHIWEQVVIGDLVFRGCILSHHTNRGGLPLPDENIFGPTTRLPEIKRRLLKELKKIAGEEITALSSILSDEELAKIGLTRT